MAWNPADSVFSDLTPDKVDFFQGAPSSSSLGIPQSTGGGGGGGGGGGFGQAEAALGIGMFGSLLGSLMQGNAAMAQANAEKAAAEYNALVAEIEGYAEAQRRRRIHRRELSSQFVQMAGKSGVLAEEGGWLEVLASNAAEMEVDALNAEIAGRNTARLERYRGATAMAIGKQKRTAALISGFTNLAYQGLSYGLPS